MFVESSKDILYLVISFCVLWVTVFICWMFYYVMRILRNANQVVEEFRMRLQTLTEAINYIRGKVEHMSGLLGLVTDGVGGMVKNMVTKKAKEWVNSKSNDFNDAAQEAVESAVTSVAKKMKRTAKSLKK